ncbi:exported protein of unknown function [Maridesulfovibrio hydrothermalis AM13 = DSM 14728]|uniref:Uncharacterized protein n=1 Tax=Maridesulfovibrio hydrothermalis AM13 = DSM 14728 TaxID=1121451 RepID=L0RDA9_9BACT|nr:exported protein of unknown function [Maridesulfovibrio hydrothermalis AM13 = DSM 14728]
MINGYNLLFTFICINCLLFSLPGSNLLLAESDNLTVSVINNLGLIAPETNGGMYLTRVQIIYGVGID